MKTFAQRFPGKKPDRGFLAACANCGEIVVHADSTLMPHHMHRYSAKCALRGRDRHNAKERRK